MKKTTFILLGIAGVLLTGCLVTSVCPFYTEKDSAFEPALLGNWSKVQQADEHWKFAKDGSAYLLSYTPTDGKTSVMETHLFRLKGETFLDLFATDKMEGIQPPPVPSHFLLRVLQITPTVKLAPLNYDWLKEVLANDSKALRHHIVKTGDRSEDRRIVITADTPELQQFVIKHLKTEAAWQGAFELERDLSAGSAIK